jgi:molybdopterin-guanine dinucleotide biosynthesis protein A
VTPDGIRLAGVIIAGGLSSRMQEGGIAGDKFLLSLDSQTIIEHVASRLSPQVSNPFVNANGDPNRLAKLNTPIVSDLPSAHGGPLVGLRTAFEYASGFPFLLSVAADSPFLPLDLATQLCERQKKTGASIVLASSGGRVHPIFGLWKTDLAQPLNDWLVQAEKPSVFAFARHIGFEEVEFPLVQLANGETFDPFLNINTPDDLAEAKRLNEALR